MNKYFVLLAYLTIIAAIGLMLLFGFWLLYPYKTITFNNIPFPTNKTEYKTGDSLVYTVDYCKYSNITPSVTRFYINTAIYLISSSPAVNKPKGCSVTQVQLIIPQSLTADTYHLKISYAYKVNPIRTVTVEASTSAFLIK